MIAGITEPPCLRIAAERLEIPTIRGEPGTVKRVGDGAEVGFAVGSTSMCRDRSANDQLRFRNGWRLDFATPYEKLELIPKPKNWAGSNLMVRFPVSFSKIAVIRMRAIRLPILW